MSIEEKQNLILLGAGASYGAGDASFGWDDSPESRRPALGNNLFKELQIFDPTGWGLLETQLAAIFTDDFEKGMKELFESYPLKTPVLQRAMAGYFFGFRPLTSCLYVKLANRIKNSNWNGSIATLNYERLLELSLRHVDLKPVCGEPTNMLLKKIEVCFPHGCCHIFCDSVKGVANGNSFSAPHVQTNGEIIVISDPNQFYTRIRDELFPPVMCYYDSKKQITSGANFINDQNQRLKELIHKASKIAIVGIRVRAHDEHIWEPLAKTDAQLIYCSGKDTAEFDLWKNKNRKAQTDIIINKFFKESFAELCDHLSL